MTQIFDLLCGESGTVNEITQKQDEIREAVTTGKNAIDAVKKTAAEVETLQDAIQNSPGVIERRLQEDIKNLLTQEALANPLGAIRKLLEIRSTYQEAGPAFERVIENVESFIKDPLNTPLNLCDDIPNIVKIGDEIKELELPSVVPDGAPVPAIKEAFTKEIGISDFATVPRFPSEAISDAIEIAGRYSGIPVPGSASEAANSQ